MWSRINTTQAIDAKVSLVGDSVVFKLMTCKVGNKSATDRSHVAIVYITERVRREVDLVLKGRLCI